MSPLKVFCCYAHEDQRLLNRLKAHLKSLQRQGLISIWNDTDISPGTYWEEEVKKHGNTAQIILLLVSANFLESDYCYGKEMIQAVERHDRGEAKVIPIILRPVDWEGTPFGKLQALPTNAKPVTDWRSLDGAFADIAKGIRKVVMQEPPKIPTPMSAKPSSSSRFTPPRKPVQNPSVFKPATLTYQQFRPGDRVSHPKFGDGIVVMSEVVDSEVVEVQFKGEYGKKRLRRH